MITKTSIESGFDSLLLSAAHITPLEGTPKGLVQIVHGMAEHKERYYPLMEYLSENGYAAIIHDHRGHGGSVKSPDDLGYLYEGGWNAMVEDIKSVNQFAKQEFPGCPVTLFGHSMGSMAVMSFIKRYDKEIDKLIVCGCPSDNPAKGAGYILARLTATIRGGHFRSGLLDGMSFGSYNKPFEKEGEFAWLSADRDNVKAYISDPLCGYTFTANGFTGLLGLMKDCYGKDHWKMANPTLPIKFISGGDDPCRINDQAFEKAVQFLRDRGYSNVRSHLYPGLRHEILNESCRKDIYKDILDFIRESN